MMSQPHPFWLDMWLVSLLQVRIHFELYLVRYLWTLVQPQYSPSETWPKLCNPLGLSQGLKSSLTGPQLWTKTAAIEVLFWVISIIMVQSPTSRNWYVFYRVKYVRYCQLSEASKHTKFSPSFQVHTKMPWSPLTTEVHAMNHRMPPAWVGAAKVVVSMMTVGVSKVAETKVVAARVAAEKVASAKVAAAKLVAWKLAAVAVEATAVAVAGNSAAAGRTTVFFNK